MQTYKTQTPDFRGFFMDRIFTSLLIKTIGFYINFLSYVFPKKATKLAYKFFSEPREGRLKPNLIPEVLQEAEIEFISLDNHNFPIYFWKGNENKVLLVHGWESNAARWEPFLPYLKKHGSSIIALDGPAHGLANGVEFNVPQYAAFINHVVQKHRPQVIIGHSIGGSACLYFQHRYNSPYLQKMVLLGAPSDLEILLTNYVKLLGLNTRVLQQLNHFFSQRFNIKVEEFQGKLLASTLQLDGIISHDVEDNVVAFSESKKIASAWKKAAFIETKGLGHSMHDQALYQQIEKFLFTA